MKLSNRTASVSFLILFFLASSVFSDTFITKKNAPPEANGIWIQPSADSPAEPRWGIKGGIQFGIWPSSGRGPRGLIRIYAPYVGFADDRTVNFIAIEPMKNNRRSLSELEISLLDNERGLRFWSVNTLDEIGDPEWPWEPARGEIITVPDDKGGEVEALRVVIVTEKFRAGMQIAVEAVIRADHPHEVRLRPVMHGKQIDIDACVLSATMGNFMRLRQLWLRDQMRTSHLLYRGYRESDFAPHRAFLLHQLFRTPDGDVLVAATPDEADLADAEFHPDVRRHWREAVNTCTQYWRVESKHVRDSLRVQVNGRYAYWASAAPIPGGVSIENFELVDDYRPGQEFIFGISPNRITSPLAESYQQIVE